MKTPVKQTYISAFIAVCFLIAMVFIYAGSRSLPSPLPPTNPQVITVNGRMISADEQGALNVPLHNATDRERMTHAAFVEKLAQAAPALDITGCKPTPLVYRINLNGTFQVKNDDYIPHALRYLTFQIQIPAQATTTVKTAQLFKTAGDYGYGCDNPFMKMGVFMVR